MPKFSKQAIMDALQTSINAEQAEYERKVAEAPKQNTEYEERRKEWSQKFAEWKIEAPKVFQEAIDKITLEDIDSNWNYVNRQFGYFGIPWPPQKPQELQNSLVEKSAHCSRTERALMRISLMMEAKDGSITLNERDEIFSYQLIPCR